MSNASRISAFLAYLLPVVSWIYVAAARKNDTLAMHHTKQSISVFGLAVGTLLGWLVLGWFVSFIPFIGFVVMVAFFTLVIIVFLVTLINLIMGMVYALQAKLDPLPVMGNLTTAFSPEKSRAERELYEVYRTPEYIDAYSVEEATVTVIGFGRRLASAIIDIMLLGFATVVLAIAFSFLGWLYSAFQPGEPIPFTTLFLILGLISSVAYYLGFWAKNSGQTIGKAVLSIRVVGANGASLSWRQAVLRYIGYIMSGLVFSIGFLWISFDKKRQGWHDKISRTYVINSDDNFLNAKSVEFVQSDPGRSWVWIGVWLIIAVFAPIGTLSTFFMLGPFINSFVTNLFQG